MTAGCLAGRGRSGTDGRTGIEEEFSISMALLLRQTWDLDPFLCFLSCEHCDAEANKSPASRGLRDILAQNTLGLGSLGGVEAGNKCTGSGSTKKNADLWENDEEFEGLPIHIN